MLLLENSPRRKKNFWKKEETELLIKCVDKYDTHWARIIKNNPIFKENGRTQIDLKDKWRNILKSRKNKAKREQKNKIVLYTEDSDSDSDLLYDSDRDYDSGCGCDSGDSDDDDIPLKKSKSKPKKKSKSKPKKKSKTKTKPRKKSKSKSKKKSKKKTKKKSKSKSKKKSKSKSKPRKKSKSKKNSYKIYTIEGCGYCIKAKDLFKKNKIKYAEIEVTDENENEIYKKVDKKTNKYRSFPMIFKNNKFIGGFSDLDKNNL